VKTLGAIVKLSDEQEAFIDAALSGANVLVDACIGSGKTTSIQQLCNRLGNDKKVLYLTYNVLLKLDAQAVIRSDNVFVTNYHSFARRMLLDNYVGLPASIGDYPEAVADKFCKIPHYDVLIVDEYQDIAEDTAKLLKYIKRRCSDIQIIMVGDMCQKIYDVTELDVLQFVHEFVGPNAVECSFTKCFRLSAGLASWLGRIWEKPIIGVNHDCIVEEMSFNDAAAFLNTCEVKDILCLGSSFGDRVRLQNKLERMNRAKFNKKTLWSKVGDLWSGSGTRPSKDAAVFTTYDGSKGMERNICVVCDFSVFYWESRIEKPYVQWDILRNIFCVAASRGKRRVIFMRPSKANWLTSEVLLRDVNKPLVFSEPLWISEMFNHKARSRLLAVAETVSQTAVQEQFSTIPVRHSDGYIDLSICIGNYQTAMYFSGYDICLDIDRARSRCGERALLKCNDYGEWPLYRQVLYLTALKTKQVRYFTQVHKSFISDAAEEQIRVRLAKHISQDACVQVGCALRFFNDSGGHIFDVCGRADAVVDNTVYLFRFVPSLSSEDILQCAMYVMALNLERSLLWNVMTDEMIEVRVADENVQSFFDAVTGCVTRGKYVSCHVERRVSTDPPVWEKVV
jgi:hypothetical protein